MANSIRVSAIYCFRGETFSPSAVIDLDALLVGETELDFHVLLAQRAGIDTYSYAFEVMQEAELVFSEPTGLAVDHLHDGRFDLAGFMAAVREDHVLEQLQAIAARLLDIDDLNARPDLREALLQAYRLGKHA